MATAAPASCCSAEQQPAARADHSGVAADSVGHGAVKRTPAALRCSLPGSSRWRCSAGSCNASSSSAPTCACSCRVPTTPEQRLLLEEIGEGPASRVLVDGAGRRSRPSSSPTCRARWSRAARQPNFRARHERRVRARRRARRVAAVSLPAVADARHATRRCAVSARRAAGARARPRLARRRVPRAVAAARSDAGAAEAVAALATDAGAAARVRRLVRSRRHARAAARGNAGAGVRSGPPARGARRTAHALGSRGERRRDR